MEEVYEDVIQGDEFIYQEDYQEDYPTGNEEVPDETFSDTKENDTGFSSKDVVDIIKAITGNNEENSSYGSEEISDLEEEVSGGNVEEEVPEVIQEQSEIQTYDYTEILQEIKNDISSGNTEITEQNYILGQLYDDSKPTSSIDNLSVTNLLLLCIFVLFLVDLLFKIIRGLF